MTSVDVGHPELLEDEERDALIRAEILPPPTKGKKAAGHLLFVESAEEGRLIEFIYTMH